MRVIVLSDTHGLVDEVGEVIQHFKPEKILHCGDFCVPIKGTPFEKMVLVRGNCDINSSVPLQRTLEWKGLKVWMTHGHQWRVKSSLLPLSYQAENVGANVILFGHSHVPVTIFEKGRLYINPGSLLQPRGYPKPTFVVLGIERKDRAGKTNRFDIKVDFYDRSYRQVEELGGKYEIEV